MKSLFKAIQLVSVRAKAVSQVSCITINQRYTPLGRWFTTCYVAVSTSGSNFQIPSSRFVCRFVMQSIMFWAWGAAGQTKPRKARQ